MFVGFFAAGFLAASLLTASYLAAGVFADDRGAVATTGRRTAVAAVGFFAAGVRSAVVGA